MLFLSMYTVIILTLRVLHSVIADQNELKEAEDSQTNENQVKSQSRDLLNVICINICKYVCMYARKYASV